MNSIKRTGITLITLLSVALSQAAGEVAKGTPEAPRSPQALVGSYYRGDGLGYNVTLDLQEGQTYTAEWHGCVGKYGSASGTWSLENRRVVFSATKEDGMMKDHLKTLEVLKFNRDWILVPGEARDREFYDKRGVTRSSCFQKRSESCD